ncbi:hypothetical protein JNK13_02370 [bacterium]|nr:hypothetical protein [bacterium]
MADSGSKITAVLSEAQGIIDAAEKRAQEITLRAENVVKEAQVKGYQEGFNSGREEALKLSIRLLEESGAVGDALAKKAANLALLIAKKIIGDQAKIDPQVVQDLAVKTLREAVTDSAAQIIVHPEDQKSIEAISNILKRISGGSPVAILTDQSITRGGCVVRTSFGEVDAQIETLIQNLAHRFEFQS